MHKFKLFHFNQNVLIYPFLIRNQLIYVSIQQVVVYLSKYVVLVNGNMKGGIQMLQTQVNYWTLQEAKRHNVITENLGYATLDETKRHNISVENYNTAFLNETSRHNVVQENLGYDTLFENMRHNKQTEELGFQTLNETTRHNVAIESETKRHNKAEESLGYANVNLGYANLTNEKNKLAELNRSNLANESIAQQNANTNYQNANTNQRNSQVNEVKMKVETPSNVLKNWGSYFSSVFGSFTSAIKIK